MKKIQKIVWSPNLYHISRDKPPVQICAGVQAGHLQKDDLYQDIIYKCGTSVQNQSPLRSVSNGKETNWTR